MTMSNHFKLSLKSIAAIALVFLGLFLWLKYKIHDVAVPKQVILPVQDKELISFNENSNTLTVTTVTGTTKEYSRNPTVEIQKNGSVKIDAHAYGTELRPFIGLGYSDTGRVYVGCDLLYFHAFDAGVSFGWTANANRPAFQPLLSVGYDFYSNSSLNVGFDPSSLVLERKPEIAVFLSVRL
jgi:hypothetical protein